MCSLSVPSATLCWLQWLGGGEWAGRLLCGERSSNSLQNECSCGGVCVRVYVQALTRKFALGPDVDLGVVATRCPAQLTGA